MSWCDLRPDRRAALLLLLSLPAGCAFQPLYGPGGEGSALRGQVALEGVDGRLGFAFRDRLRDRVGDPAADAAYVLDARLRFSRTGLAITRRDDVTRYDIAGEAAFALRRRADGAVLAEGTVRSVSAYNTLASPYAARVAERDAERRVAADLADRVYASILAAPAGQTGAGPDRAAQNPA